MEIRKKQICLNCGQEMTEVYDEIAHKYTGHLMKEEQKQEENKCECACHVAIKFSLPALPAQCYNPENICAQCLKKI